MATHGSSSAGYLDLHVVALRDHLRLFCHHPARICYNPRVRAGIDRIDVHHSVYWGLDVRLQLLLHPRGYQPTHSSQERQKGAATRDISHSRHLRMLAGSCWTLSVCMDDPLHQ